MLVIWLIAWWLAGFPHIDTPPYLSGVWLVTFLVLLVIHLVDSD